MTDKKQIDSRASTARRNDDDLRDTGEVESAVAEGGGAHRMLIALVVVYLSFGSAVVAGKIAVASIPPLVIGGRFVLAGGLILAWLWWRGRLRREDVGRRQWIASLIVGGLLLLGGQGGSVTALRSLPAGTVALLMATVPLWVEVLGWAVFKEPLGRRELAGVCLGIAGLAVLIGPGAVAGEITPGGLLLCVGAALSWSIGLLYAKHSASLPHKALVATALQMLCGGLLLSAASAISGELARFDVGAVSWRSLVAFAYLFVVVALIGFPVYTWLQQNASPVLASTFAYVAPVVAVFLSWVVLGEEITGRTLAASGIILGSVGLMVTGGRSAAKPTHAAPCAQNLAAHSSHNSAAAARLRPGSTSDVEKAGAAAESLK